MEGIQEYLLPQPSEFLYRVHEPRCRDHSGPSLANQKGMLDRRSSEWLGIPADCMALQKELFYCCLRISGN